MALLNKMPNTTLGRAESSRGFMAILSMATPAQEPATGWLVAGACSWP